MSEQHIAIDLGHYQTTYSIKGDRPEGVSLDSVERYPATHEFGSKGYFKEVKKQLADISKRHGIKRAVLHITLANLDNDTSSIQFLTLPTKDDKVIKKAVSFELGQDDTLERVDDVQTTWKKVPIDEDIEAEDKTGLEVHTLTKSLLFQLAQLRKLKWTVASITLQPEAIADTVTGHTAVIDLGHASTRVYLYKDGRLAHLDVIESGGRSMNERIKQSVDSDDSALFHDWKTNVSLASDLSPDPSLTGHALSVASIVGEETLYILDEIKRVIRGFELQEFITIETVVYAGGGTHVPHFPEALENKLSKSITPLDTLVRGEMSDRADTVEGSIGFEALVLLDTDRAIESVNFAPSLRYQFDYVAILIAVVCLSLVMHAGVYVLNQRYDDTLMDLTSQQTSQIKTEEELSIKTRELTLDIRQKEALTERIYGLQNHKHWLSDMLFVLPDKTPQEVAIRRINLSGHTTKIEGYARDYSDVSMLAIELEELGAVSIDALDRFDPVDNTYAEGPMYSEHMKDTDIPNATQGLPLYFELTLTE